MGRRFGWGAMVVVISVSLQSVGLINPEEDEKRRGRVNSRDLEDNN